MSKYTTGEMAKLCGVTVRTVQYYDSRKILVPSELSEGGRRLYAEADLKKLKMICFLREMGLSINSITSILAEENSSNVITLLLEEQSRTLRQEIAEREARLHTVEQFAQEIKTCSSYSVEAIHDMAYTMANRKKLWRVHLIMLALGIVMDVIEVVALFYAIAKGVWLPFIIGMPVVRGRHMAVLSKDGLYLPAVPCRVRAKAQGIPVFRAYAQDKEAYLRRMRVQGLLR